MTKTLTCAICGAELPAGAAEGDLFPFCSGRCKMIDLGRWFEGEYAVVSPASIEDMEEELDRQADEDEA